jgi:hypothetical protein
VGAPTALGESGKVHYTVTYTGTPEAQTGIASHRAPNLDAALKLACQFLKERRPDVTIEDGKGNSISGADLLACCHDQKLLIADLRAVERETDG